MQKIFYLSQRAWAQLPNHLLAQMYSQLSKFEMFPLSTNPGLFLIECIGLLVKNTFQ